MIKKVQISEKYNFFFYFLTWGFIIQALKVNINYLKFSLY